MANGQCNTSILLWSPKLQPKDLKLDAKENSELVLVNWHQKHEKTQGAQKNHLRWKQEKGVHYHVIMYQAMIRICHISNYNISSHYKTCITILTRGTIITYQCSVNKKPWKEKPACARTSNEDQEQVGQQAGQLLSLFSSFFMTRWLSSKLFSYCHFFLSFFYDEEVVQHAGFGVFNVTIRKWRIGKQNLYSKAVSITVSIGGNVHGVIPYLGSSIGIVLHM